MKLTRYTDVALRTLMQAGLHDDRRSSISEVATRFRVPRNHVVKAVHQLGRLGFLETTRGRGGGFRLARPAEEVAIGAVVRATEEFALLECFAPEIDTCPITPACRLKGLLGRAMAAFFSVLDETTLADLIESRGGLEKLLDRTPGTD